MKKFKTEKEIDIALSSIRKDLVSALSAGTSISASEFQIVTVSDNIPLNTEGSEGDIHLRNVNEATQVYQKISVDTWELKGTVSSLNLYYPTQF